MNRLTTNKTKSVEQKNISRRNIFINISNFILGIVGIGSLGIIYRFLSPNVLLEIPSRFRIGSPDDFQPDSVLFVEEHQLFVVRDAQGFFYALSAVCTHLGCLTRWQSGGIPGFQDGVINCPCHGSVFKRNGDVAFGPAPRALDRFRISLEDGKLIVDKSEIVSEEEMILKI